MRSLRMLCTLLTLLLMLPGPMAAAEGPQVAMGRYVEVPLDIPSEAWGAFSHTKGTIYAVNGSGNTLLKSLDLEKNNWDYLETGYDDKTATYQGGVNGLTVGEDGALYISSGWSMSDSEYRPFIERIVDGASQRIQLDRRLDTGVDRLMMCALPSGELLGLSDEAVYRFSEDGKTSKTYAVSGGESMAVHVDEFAVCSSSNGLITVLDLESGQVLRTLPLPISASYGLVGYDAEGALYYVSPDGIYRVNAGGTLIEQIADGRLMTVSKPSVVALALLFDGENNPVIAYSQGGSVSLIAYRYDENVATEPSTMLSIFTLYDSGTLRECANQFQQRYPDAMVDIVVALPEGTAVTRDDAIRTLNTEVLAGKGPDVIVLDGLPVQSYIDKAVLIDLSDTIQPMIDSGAVLSNIAGTFAKDGQMLAVPTRFNIPTLWGGNVEGIDTLSDLADWARANPDKPALYHMSPEGLIRALYLSCAPGWMDGDGRLAEAKLQAFLEALQAVRGKWTAENMPEHNGFSLEKRLAEGGESLAWNPYQSGQNSDFMEMFGAEELGRGTFGFSAYVLRGYCSVNWPNGSITALQKGGFCPMPGQTERVYMPCLMLGVNAKSPNADLGKAFVQFALSEQPQKTEMLDGFAINTQALAAMQATELSPIGSFGIGLPVDPYSYSSEWPNRQMRDELRTLMDELTVSSLPDMVLYQMIVSESKPFFDGTIDAKQAAQNVCAKANAYLSE